MVTPNAATQPHATQALLGEIEPGIATHYSCIVRNFPSQFKKLLAASVWGMHSYSNFMHGVNSAMQGY